MHILFRPSALLMCASYRYYTNANHKFLPVSDDSWGLHLVCLQHVWSSEVLTNTRQLCNELVTQKRHEQMMNSGAYSLLDDQLKDQITNSGAYSLLNGELT